MPDTFWTKLRFGGIPSGWRGYVVLFGDIGMPKLPFWPFGLNPEHQSFLELLAAKLHDRFGKDFSLNAAQGWYEEEERRFQENDPEAIAFARM